jgi:peptidoglycan/xylan/chitin deacetylase (PgdA/CDA1 family)
VIAARVLAGAAVGWIAYAWAPHLATPLVCARRGARSGRRIALTFDDGPDPSWTPRVLAILAGRRVPASFFLVGARAARAPDTVRRIAGAGHDVLNHGWSHRNLWLCGPRRTQAEVGRAHEVLATLAGREPRYFRPPWGMVNAVLWRALGRYRERCVLWSIQPEGLRPCPAEAQTRRVVRWAHPGAIVALHDAEGTPGAPARLCAALPLMIDGLRDAGYEFATVGELLPDERDERLRGGPIPGAGARGSRGTRRPPGGDA